MNMDKSINESIKKVKEIHAEISKVNDLTIKETENLRIILLNLKIENARNTTNNGITPIAEQLEKVINNLHNNVRDLVTEGRKELRQAFRKIEEYIVEKEGLDNE